MNSVVGAEVLRRVKAGDGQFFKDLGETIERSSAGRWPDDKYRHALVMFAISQPQTGAPLSVAKVRELRDSLKKEGIIKSLGAIRRDLRLLGFPYLRGKPGVKPAPRRAHKRRRGVSMRELQRSVEKGSKQFWALRRKSEHIP
jgi:hypothetical protein